MTLRPAGRVVVRCPNQHEFEIDMFDPQLLAVQRFVCELCGASFGVEASSGSPVQQRPYSAESRIAEDSLATG